MVIVHNRKQRRHCCQVVVWRLALQQLNYRAADAPYVRRRTGTRELDDLRGHPVRGTDNLGFLVLASSKGARRDAEICQLDGAIFCGQDICAFDIAVYDTLVVQVLKPLEYLRHIDAD